MSSCVPEKIARDAANDGNPGTEPLLKSVGIKTQRKSINPKNVAAKPKRIESLSGTTL
jgi:hypothetical protein